MLTSNGQEKLEHNTPANPGIFACLWRQGRIHLGGSALVQSRALQKREKK